MTLEDLKDFCDKLDKDEAAFLRGEIPDDMTPEARKNWIEKCNA